MSDKSKDTTTAKKSAPAPPHSQSPTFKKNQQKVTKSDDLMIQGSASQPTKGDQHKKTTADQAKACSMIPVTQSQPSTVDAKTAGSSQPNSGGSPQPPSQLKNNTNNKQPDHAKTDPNTKPTDTEHTDAGTPTEKAPSDVEKTQKPNNPESKGTSESHLQPKDLVLGKTITGILDALGLLDNKEDAMKEYQALLKQQRFLEAQLSPEKRNSLHELKDKMMAECSKIGHAELSGPLINTLLELKQKHPEKCDDALKELTFRKKLVEDLQGSIVPEQRTGGHVTHVDVGKQSANPTEKKDNPQKQLHKGNEKPQPVKPDESESTLTELEEAKKGEGRRDPEKFRVIIPDGYQLVRSEDYEHMQYELVNQRESIEELTSRLSAIASSKLKAGNPNIADLSDKNRPTKVGEQFAAMYDDQWSEAFEAMDKGEEENEEEEIKSIDELLNVVKESYQFCGSEADKQLQKIAMSMKDAVSLQQTPEKVATVVTELEKATVLKQKQDTEKMSEKSTDIAQNGLNQTPVPVSSQAVSKPDTRRGQSKVKIGSAGVQPKQKLGAASGQPGQTSGAAVGPPGKTTPPDEEKKGETAEVRTKSPISETWQTALRCARSFRKETAMTAVTEIKQLFKDQYKKKLDPPATLPDAMMKYIDRCVELMWLMAVQDPPMEIKWADKGERSDTNYFKFYQSKGKMVRQCVWPAVFLSAHGGIVSKGYIMGMTPPPPEQTQKKKSKIELSRFYN